MCIRDRVYLILQDGIQQAVSAGDPAALRMTAIYADANAYLKSTNDAPHVVYLDPMFPDNKKSAKNKKEMQVLQNLVGHSTDDQDLLKLARATAVNRVVVKRPVKAPAYAQTEPDFTISGKNIRYDVYSNRRFS